MFIGLFSGNAMQIFLYYLLFLLVDASVSIMAYIFEHEKPVGFAVDNSTEILL